ncbi:DUF1810 domain-containing protein [Pseudoroseicyclus sp. CXY001]|uniref:DUF1810 domain-containing protein n=1 Tax=Pseudoroseicyclus sp. CXY001 TaxID=3242492 RepID=UPI00358DAF83
MSPASARADAIDAGRFLAAQEPVWPQVQAELRAGRKRSHWMWWIFPQIAGLGRSDTARAYALAGLDEAAAYLAHPVLGARLVEAAELVLASGERDAERLMGPVDALKLRSSMTLFAAVPGAPPVFSKVLAALYSREPDPLTLQRLPAP